MNPALAALAVAAFGVGTTEFVVMGLLPGIAHDLDIDLPAAGTVVSAYAAGVVVGAPLMAIATNRIRRKTALLFLMSIFILGNLCCAVAPTFGLIIAARVLTAFAHGAFFGLAALVAAQTVPEARRTQAIALVFAGLTVANVLGVPGGTMLGSAFGWRSTFIAVAACGGLGLAMMARFLPSGPAGVRPDLGAEFRVLGRPSVLLAMAVTVAMSAAFFVAFTFVSPYLSQVKHLSVDGINVALMVFGVGMTAGGLVGGRLADRSLAGALRTGSVAVVLVLLAIPFVPAVPAAILAMMAVWGAVTFLVAPALQMQVMNAADGAPTAASTLNQAAFNLGNLLGAWVAATALSGGLPYADLPVLAAAFAGVAVILAGLATVAGRGRIVRPAAA